jgi:thiol peroxidase
MAEITFKGTPVQTNGSLPSEGDSAPDFALTTQELKDVGLGDFEGKKKILNIVPSIDTSVCAESARKFNEAVNARGDTVLLNVSKDLPFALKRFCEAEGLSEIVPLSELRNQEFGEAYGVRMINGPMAGLLARAVVILDPSNKVMYTELVPEIAQEPDYDAALGALD